MKSMTIYPSKNYIHIILFFYNTIMFRRANQLKGGEK